MCAAMNPSVVMPSSIGSSGRPTPRIWKKWSMTQIESKPASSASRTIRASVGPIASGPPGQVNDGIWRPTFIGTGRSRRAMTTSRIVPSPSGGLAPRTSATGRPAVLPSASSAAEASSSATARTVVRITRPSASGWPRRSSSGRMPGHAERDVDDAPAPRPPEAVRDDDREVDAEPGRGARPGCAPRRRRGRPGSSVTSRPSPGRRSRRRCRRSRTRSRGASR